MNENSGCFAFLRQLMADGITCIFGNPGTSEENLLDALSQPEFTDLKYYMALQEGSAVAMGDSYARSRQVPAVVQLHSYAGLANGLGMMYYARRGYTPMVVIAGEAGLKYEALDGQMAANLVDMARPFVKSDYNGPCAWRIVHRGSVLRLLRRALKAAATPPRGPVFLALPMDVLDDVNDEPITASLASVNTSVTPDPAVVSEAVRALAGAQRPLFIVGDGISASGAQQELTQLAELLGAPVWGANYSEVNMPASHPLFQGSFGHMFGSESKQETSKADVVLVCGTTLLPEVFPELEGVFAPNACIIHFDLNTYEIAKNFPTNIAALADPKPTLKLLAEEIRTISDHSKLDEARRRIEEAKEKKQAALQRQLEADERLAATVPMHSSLFMKELGKRLPKGALIFDEALTNSDELGRYLPQDEPGTFFQTRAGMLGTGLPGAVGLKAAHPDRVVFGFSGDGGSMSTIQAISTAARHGLGAKLVVCNNRSYRILKLNLQEYWKGIGASQSRPFPASFELTQPKLRFDQLAEAQGVRGIRVEKPEEVVPAIETALADDKPILIDLVIDGTV
jgi:benzoylformate decarboxylase